MHHQHIVDLYERHARDFDRDRSRALQEKAWLDRFIDLLGSERTVLDVGCGMGEPLARYLIEQGCRAIGIDSSASMIAMCRQRFPGAEWLVSDMRALDLGRQFDGILAWDSFFHLCADDQRAMFPRFAAHARHGAPLMFTAGYESGEEVGCYAGEPLYHASLDPAEYKRLLSSNGFSVHAYKELDRACGEHTIWLARFDGSAAV